MVRLSLRVRLGATFLVGVVVLVFVVVHLSSDRQWSVRRLLVVG